MSIALELLYNNIIALVIFFIVYSLLFTYNKDNFKGVNNYIDIFYYTTATQSTIGSSDVVPDSSLTRFISSVHHLIILAISVKFIHMFIHHHKS